MKCVEFKIQYGCPNSPGFTSSIFKGWRLNGSVGSLRRCDRIVDRSILVFDPGSITGSFIKSYIKGSAIITISLCSIACARARSKFQNTPRKSFGISPKSSSTWSSISFAFLTFSPKANHAAIASDGFSDHLFTITVAFSNTSGL